MGALCQNLKTRQLWFLANNHKDENVDLPLKFSPEKKIKTTH